MNEESMHGNHRGAQSAGTHPGAMANLSVRPAGTEDRPAILELLRKLELDYPARDLDRFFVAERDGKVLGISELKEFDAFYLLSCVGIDESLQGSGLGKALVSAVLKGIEKDVYLYTLVPEFFRKVGFVDAAAPPPELPPRLYYGCAGCDPKSCLCLVRKADAPRISGV